MTYVICVNEIDAVHRWKTCPTAHPHNYLSNDHRHRFYIETAFEVRHDDRDVEIFEMQDAILKFIGDTFTKEGGLFFIGSTSCESLARMIADELSAKWCEVREDGRGGARYVREEP